MFVSPSINRLCLKPLFLLCFFAALRISELTPNIRFGFSGLIFDDIQFFDSVSIFIRHSKTDQLGLGKQLFLNEFKGSLVCPVTSLRNFVSLRPPISYYSYMNLGNLFPGISSHLF